MWGAGLGLGLGLRVRVRVRVIRQLVLNAIANVSRIDDKMTHHPHKSIRHDCLGLG
jgi:hypothetical protein